MNRRGFAAAWVCSFLFVATGRAETLRLYLSIPPLAGEASPAGFPNVIGVNSFSLSSTGPTALSVVKPVDAVSPALFNAATSGTIFPLASLFAFDATNTTLKTQLNFHNVIVSSDQVLGLNESVTFSTIGSPSSHSLDLDIPGAGLTPLQSLTVSGNQFSFIAQNPATVLPTALSGARVLFSTAGGPALPDVAFTFGTLAPAGPGTFTFETFTAAPVPLPPVLSAGPTLCAAIALRRQRAPQSPH